MDKIYAQYIKPGHNIWGLPARDMTKAEWESQDEDKKKLGIRLGLYKIVSAKAKVSTNVEKANKGGDK